MAEQDKMCERCACSCTLPSLNIPGMLEAHPSFSPFFADGLAAFRAFLKSEYCEENIDFWLACEDFKKTKSTQKLSAKAKKIYNDFIEKEAPKEVSKTTPLTTTCSVNSEMLLELGLLLSGSCNWHLELFPEKNLFGKCYIILTYHIDFSYSWKNLPT